MSMSCQMIYRLSLCHARCRFLYVYVMSHTLSCSLCHATHPFLYIYAMLDVSLRLYYICVLRLLKALIDVLDTRTVLS